ncbi:hypothetical protein ACFQZV_07360 [Microbacterium koreense]|uniref:DUF308 domain-containing protein n=1 Tax=Microbacterium koreense TaxID=323761 RepID=A0ABW2ZR41_9MICO
MNDSRHDPHGPARLPDEQPPDPTDLRNQSALQAGSTRRWLIPSAVLAVVTIVLFCLAFQLQPVLPLVGIVFVMGMWIAMFVVARKGGRGVRTNRILAWLMGGLAVGALLVAIGIYLVETLSTLSGPS